MIKRFLISFGLIVTLITCTKTKVTNDDRYIEPQKTVISGQLQNYNNSINYRVASLFYDDPILNQRFRYSTSIDSNGFFKFAVYRHFPQDIYLEIETHFLIFVSPGDSLHISIKPNKDFIKQYEYCEFSGDSKLENDILKSEMLNREFNFKQYINNNKNLNSKEFKNYLLDKKEKGYKTLAEILSKYDSVPKSINNHLQYGVLSEYISHLCDYPHHHNSMNNTKVNPINSPTDYYDIFENYSLDIKQLANSGVDRDLKFYTKHKLNMLNFNSIERGTKDGFLRELLICRYIANEMSNKGCKIYNNYSKTLSNSIKSDTLFSVIHNYYSELKGSVTNLKESNLVELNEPEDESISALLDGIKNKHKDKVIYIDCWATWCAPCRKEMSLSKEFHNRFDTNKVAFVFLCIDSNVKQWENIIAKEKIEGDHYYLDMNQSKIIRSRFQIEGVPYYLIIDKNGNVSEKGNEFRPSNIITEKILEGLI